MKRRALVLLVGLLACSSSLRQDAHPQLRAQTESEIAFGGGPVPAACVGAVVDLVRMEECTCRVRPMPPVQDHHGRWFVPEGAWCGPAFKGRDMSSLLRVEFEPHTARVKSGSSTTFVLRIKNRTNERLPVVLYASDPLPPTVIEDVSGRDVRFDGHHGVAGQREPACDPPATVDVE
jgi:hypothetical protein